METLFKRKVDICCMQRNTGNELISQGTKVSKNKNVILLHMQSESATSSTHFQNL